MPTDVTKSDPGQAPDQPVLVSPRLRLRPLRHGDRDVLAAIQLSPEVFPWWGPVRDDDFLPGRDGEEVGFVIAVGPDTVGYIQYTEETDPMYRAAWMDIFLAPDHLGRGLGREAIRVLARYLLDERGHHRLSIDPCAANTAAIRCYQAVGFRPVGVMRRYELDPVTGDWRDSLLMDLLAGELAGPDPRR